MILTVLAGMSLSAEAFGAAQPMYVDVTAASGLDFTVAYGVTFDEILNHPSIPLRPTYDLHFRNLGNGAAVGDYDGDGDLDVYLLAQNGFPNRLFRNNLETDKTFTDVTTGSGVGDLGMSRAAFFADLNNDGLPDLIVMNDDALDAMGDPLHPTSRIFRNDGDGTFTDTTPGSGFVPEGYFRGGGAVADYDGDGLLDIFLATWPAANSLGVPGLPGECQLFRNLGDFTFDEVTVAVGLDGIVLNTFGPILTDFDGDRDPDIFLPADRVDDFFFLNEGGTFTDVTVAVGAYQAGNDMGVAVADYDDDGDLDLYVTNVHDPLNPNAGALPRKNALHVNQLTDTGSLTFDDETVARGVENTLWGWGTVFTDAENDGDLDIVAVNGFDELLGMASTLYDTESFLYLNDGVGQFTRELGTALDASMDSRALVAFDYDRDGDQDLLITNINQPVKLFENTAVNAGHSLTVRVRPHHRAVGAVLHSTLGATVKRRDIIPARSYLSGFPAEVHFGLGDATVVDELKVVWPDGSESRGENIAVDQTLTAEQLVLDFLSENALVHEEGEPVVLMAAAADLFGNDRGASIEWSEVGAKASTKTLATGPSFDASGRAIGSYPMRVSVRDAAGLLTSIDFELVINPVSIFSDGFESGDVDLWS